MKNTEELQDKIINQFKSYSEKCEEKITKKDEEDLISFLCDGKDIDLSGVSAIRGFIYQYYLTAHYIVEMVYSSNSWWDNVIVELLDDITLKSDDKLRFIQVKTRKESNIEANNISLFDLYTRVKSKGSWLDKLFILNLHNLNNMTDEDFKNNLSNSSKELEYEFELATNTTFSKNLLPLYTDSFINKHESYDEVTKETLKVLTNKMNTDNLDWVVKSKDSEYNFTFKDYLKDGQNPRWYLDRFQIKGHGAINFLRETVSRKIQSSTPGNRDHFHFTKSTRVFDFLVQEIISRTSNDNSSVNFKKFVFSKKECAELFEGLIEKFSVEFSISYSNDSYHEKFSGYFSKIREDFFNSPWSSELQSELIKTTEELEMSLQKNITENVDIYAYKRLLNRIFLLENFTFDYKIDKYDDPIRIIKALKTYIHCLVFYPKVEYSSIDSSISMKEGIFHKEFRQRYSIYNARKEHDLNIIKKMIRSNVYKGSISSINNFDFYCIIEDAKSTRAHHREQKKQREIPTDSINSSITDIKNSTSSPGAEDVLAYKDITKLTENIKFINGKEVEELLYDLDYENEILSFKNQPIVKHWIEKLKTIEI